MTVERVERHLVADTAGYSLCWWLSVSVLLAVLLAHALLSTSIARAEPATTIRLNWTEVFDRISPDPRTGIKSTKNMTVTLHGGREISQAYDTSAGRYTRSSVRSTQLGNDWRVGSNNVLVRTDNFPNHLRVMTVRVDGRSSCSLSVTHELKSGRTIYLYPMLSRPGQTGSYSRIVAQSANCSIK